jgi:RNA polymerase sporulation-specific sigma factor
MLRTKKKSARDVSLYEPIGTDKEGNEISLLDITCAEGADAFELLSAREDISRLRSILHSSLNERELEVIRLRYALSGGRELTQREIGQLMGISRSYVSRIEKKALKKLRVAFEDTTTM